MNDIMNEILTLAGCKTINESVENENEQLNEFFYTAEMNAKREGDPIVILVDVDQQNGTVVLNSDEFGKNVYLPKPNETIEETINYAIASYVTEHKISNYKVFNSNENLSEGCYNYKSEDDKEHRKNAIKIKSTKKEHKLEESDIPSFDISDFISEEEKKEDASVEEEPALEENSTEEEIKESYGESITPCKDALFTALEEGLIDAKVLAKELLAEMSEDDAEYTCRMLDINPEEL